MLSLIGGVITWDRGDAEETMPRRQGWIYPVNKQTTLHLRVTRQQRRSKMKVVEIVIDGFKSYAVRTVISGWDESFNSITGLNGSGKSNILDAICFVLGITSMTTVRAQNIQV